MKIQLLYILILIAAFTLPACSKEDLADLERGGSPQQQTEDLGQAKQSEQTGETGAEGQLESLIGEGGSNVTSNQGTSTAGDSGNISSSGKPGVAASGADQAGQLPSNSADSASGEDHLAKSVEWLSYVDDAFKFSIQYPDSYIILPEIEPQTGSSSIKSIHQVRFQDRQLAISDTAALQPAQFTVEVFSLSGHTSLEAFIQSNPPFSNMTIEPYTYGNLSGSRAATNRMLTPNEFFFFAGDGVIYKLTPNGKYATEMLQSFAILP